MSTKKNTKVICPYCNCEAILVTGEIIYPHRSDLYHKYFYRCAPCDAYVGCHPNTQVPLGRLANAELRKAKLEAHNAFDPLWKSGKLTRTAAYAWLAEKLGIEVLNCHIGMFDTPTCLLVIQICKTKF